jgi:hypothetical protein
MPLRFRDLVGRPGEETVAGLEKAIERAAAAAAEADAKLADLAKRRRAAIVSDDDKLCDKLDEDIRLATRDRDKALEAGLALGERLAEAKRREHQAKVDAVFAEGERAREKAVGVTRGAYAKAARAIVAAATEIEGALAAIDDVNRRLAVLGDPRRLGDPDAAARPQRGPIPLMAVPIPGGLRVPDPADSSRMLWPEGDALTARYVPPQQRGTDKVLASTGVPQTVASWPSPQSGEAA